MNTEQLAHRVLSKDGVDTSEKHELAQALIEAIEIIDEVVDGNFNQATLLKKARNFIDKVKGR